MRKFILSCALIVIGAMPASALPIVFNNRAAWQAATSSVTTHDFSQFGGGANFLGTSYTFGGVTYETAVGTDIYGVGSLGFDAAYLTSEYLEWQSPVPESTVPSVLTITFSTPITAVGFDFGTLFGVAEPMSVSVDGGPAYAIPSAADAFSFFGFTNDVAFTTLTITNPNAHTFPPGSAGFPVIDDLVFGSVLETEPAPVPEPSSLVLLGSAIAGAVAIRARRSK